MKKLTCRLKVFLLFFIVLVFVLLHFKEDNIQTQSSAYVLLYSKKDTMLYSKEDTMLYAKENVMLYLKENTMLHSKEDTMKTQSSVITNYCNNKKRKMGSEYVLSYTVFGKNSWERYGKLIEKVAQDAENSSFYHGWTVRVYHDSYPEELQIKLNKIYKKLEFCYVGSLVLPFLSDLNVSNINGMTWRFIPMTDPTVGIMCSRDLDGEIYKREEDAVSYWMRTNKTLHSMRDHPYHNVEILGGMWCFRPQNSPTKAKHSLKLMLENAGKRSSTSEATKGNDQFMLQRYLWPKVKNDVIQHDSYLCKSYPGSIAYPSQRSSIIEIIGASRSWGFEAMECPKECRPKDHQDWLYC